MEERRTIRSRGDRGDRGGRDSHLHSEPYRPSLDMDSIRQYFHLPIEAASKKLQVCTTVLKNFCRQEGIPKWPYRSVSSIDRLWKRLKAIADDESHTREVHTAALAKLARLRDLRNNVVNNPADFGKCHIQPLLSEWRRFICNPYGIAPGTHTGQSRNAESPPPLSPPLHPPHEPHPHEPHGQQPPPPRPTLPPLRLVPSVAAPLRTTARPLEENCDMDSID